MTILLFLPICAETRWNSCCNSSCSSMPTLRCGGRPRTKACKQNQSKLTFCQRLRTVCSRSWKSVAASFMVLLLPRLLLGERTQTASCNRGKTVFPKVRCTGSGRRLEPKGKAFLPASGQIHPWWPAGASLQQQEQIATKEEFQILVWCWNQNTSSIMVIYFTTIIPSCLDTWLERPACGSVQWPGRWAISTPCDENRCWNLIQNKQMASYR